MSRAGRTAAAWLAGAAVTVSSAALACPVCFGGDAEQAGLGRAYNIAIGSMLALTMGLLAAGALWFRRIERRRQALDRQYLDLLDVVDGAETPAASRSGQAAGV